MGSYRESSREGQRKQRHSDHEAQQRRLLLVDLIQDVQNVVYPDYRTVRYAW